MATASNKKLSEKQQREILSLVADGHSFRETARTLGLSDSTVRKYCAESDVDIVGETTPKTMLRLGQQVARQQKTIRELRTQLNSAMSDSFGTEDFIAEMRRVTERERKNPFQYHPSKFAAIRNQGATAAVGRDHQEIAALALSDWHIAETVRLRDSNGINVYNSIIGANRLYQIVQRFKQVFTIHRSVYKFKAIWIPLLGDMVSGSIHPEFLTTNDLSDQASTVLAARLLRDTIIELKQLGVPIILDAVVGNHPRTTFKVPTKRIADSNFDWQMYEFAKMLFEGDDQVTFNVHTSQMMPVDVFGHRYVMEHGIEWKNGHEEDSEARIRALFDDPVYRSATGYQGPSFEMIVIGNLHKPAFLERTIKNGSLIGQNELGQQWRLAPIHAKQVMWGISRGHTRTFQYELDATGSKERKPATPFGEFAYEYVKEHGITFAY